jgi:hypothetical protein
MSGHVALVSLALAAPIWLFVAFSCAILCSLFWRFHERWTAEWHPRSRSRSLTLLAIAPVLIPSVTILLCLAPGLVGVLTGTGDHCPGHSEHPHLCLFHAAAAPSLALAIGLLLLCSVLALAITRAAGDALEVGREQRRLTGGGRVEPGSEVHLVRSPAHFAFTAGFFRRQIWISSALDHGLTPRERQVVIEHERAHVARRDPARWLLAKAFSGLHLPGTRRRILAALRLASEQDCDARAAVRVGSRLRVAETLLRVEGLMRVRERGLSIAAESVGVGGSTIPDRVRLLLTEGTAEPRELPIPTLVVVGLASCALAAKPLHHTAEHAIAALLSF